MRLVAPVAVGIGLALTLTGCSTPVSGGSTAPSLEAGDAATIQDVWDIVGCKENDPLGTRGVIDLPTAPEPPVSHSGHCTPVEDGELAFFFELESPQEALDWLASGELEIGATDAVFVDGAVVILATDAATAQIFAAEFEPYGR